jgi:gliding motility-associated-like protein
VSTAGFIFNAINYPMRSFLLITACFLLFTAASAQPCTNLGQTPATAFPVCGTTVFTQNTVPLCGGTSLPSPHCPNQGLTDRNPFFYKFTCYVAGTLGFLITPNDLTSDYDWEVYDVTGIDPNTIYTNGNLVVASNWSGETGLTGSSAAGSNLFVCSGSGQALFSKMPSLVAGRNYLLLVSHFTNSQAGYKLSFGGGTAVITDPNLPKFSSAVPNCGGDIIRIKLNKKIKCSSLAVDGSDFSISPSTGAVITGATGFECGQKFDTDSIEIKLDRFLTPGNYTLQVKQGGDGNTLLDYCDNAMPGTETIGFTVLPSSPTPMDSLRTLSCSPNTLQLVFSKPIVCSSIAADGSDFTVNGNYPVAISSAAGNCSGNTTTSITLTLSQPIYRAGSFTLRLQAGSDGNTLLNECGVASVAGSSIPFLVKDTVNAAFTYTVRYGCTEDVVNFVHQGAGVDSWKWDLDDGITSNLQSPQARYTVFDAKNIRLIASNGFCSDTAFETIVLDNLLEADFNVLPDNCPLEPVAFAATATGRIISHAWDFGDGGFGSGISTTHVYNRAQRETTYNVRYTVTDSYGCSKVVQKPIKVYVSCMIDVPNAFTPNGDRKNDFLYPLNAVKADQLEFTVYNRWGQVVFRTNNWKQGWDGRLKGQEQPTGTYVWLLRYINRDTGKRVERKGYSVLIR